MSWSSQKSLPTYRNKEQEMTEISLPTLICKPPAPSSSSRPLTSGWLPPLSVILLQRGRIKVSDPWELLRLHPHSTVPAVQVK